MNYQKIYNNIIERARNRVVEGYIEVHHIVPKCLGGTNDVDNLVSLTAEEHYIVHMLLVKIYPDNKSLWYAANMMANRNNKIYAWTKKKHAHIVSQDKLGFTHDDAAKAKMSNAIAERWKDNKEGFIEEQRRRASNPKKKKDGYFKPKSDEHAMNISKAALQRPRVSCEHCGKKITVANIKNHMKVHINVSI
jgi:5-methylcytosine-specific restriction endonuclease McrA